MQVANPGAPAPWLAKGVKAPPYRHHGTVPYRGHEVDPVVLDAVQDGRLRGHTLARIEQAYVAELLTNRGRSVPQIAATLGVSARHVQRLRAEFRTN